MPQIPLQPQLQILKGVPVPVGSSGSFEGVTSINLMDPNSFSIKENGWIPKIGQVKNGGVYAEAVIGGADTLLAATLSRVVETLTLSSKAATWESRYTLEKKLSQLGYYAREFHISGYQTDPVYLKWIGNNGIGAQYSLIYDIAIAYNLDPFISANINELTITITRRPEWRWEVPPGASPKLWSVYKRGLTLKVDSYSLGVFPLSTDNSNAVYIPANVFAANVLYLNAGVESLGSAGYLKIPVSDIPGDYPAQVEFRIDAGMAAPVGAGYNPYVQSFIVSRTTRNLTGLIRNNRLPAKCGGTGASVTSTLGLDTTHQADYGAIDHHGANAAAYYSATTNHNRARCIFTTTPTVFNKRLTWTALLSQFAGTYAVFMRGHQSGGAFSEQEIYLQYGYTGDEISTTPVNPLVQAVAANTQFWPINYLGMISLPPDAERLPMSIRGLGVDNTATFTINLWARRKTGTSELYIADLVLMPIDECSAQASFDRYASSSYQPVQIMYDETGYFARGRDDMIVFDSPSTLTSVPGKLADIGGQGLTLEPGKDNYLHFLFGATRPGFTLTGVSPISVDPADASASNRALTWAAVRLNIVPRSIGLRDE